MEWFDGHVGALEGTLEQRPEVLKAVGVDLSVYVRLGMVDNAVDIIGAQAVVGHERIGIDRRTGFDVLPHFGLDVRPTTALEDHSPNLRYGILAVSVEQSHDGGFT